MKLNAIIESLSEQLRKPWILSTINEARGFLVQSDPRIDFLIRKTGGMEYQHSAMPLLDVKFKDSFMFAMELDTGNAIFQAGRFTLYQDALWLFDRKLELLDPEKFSTEKILRIEISIPPVEDLQRSRVSDFLDKI